MTVVKDGIDIRSRAGSTGEQAIDPDLLGSLTTNAANATLLAEKAPIPQMTAGVGQVRYVSAGDGIQLNFPAGGTWMVMQFVPYATATNVAMATGATNLVGVGGSMIYAGLASWSTYAEVWRVA